MTGALSADHIAALALGTDNLLRDIQRAEMGSEIQDAAEPQGERTKVRSNDAVEKAKEWLIAIMAGEKVYNLGLEEVEHQAGCWFITLGFSRPWDESRNAITVLNGAVVMRRTFKVITIAEDTGEIISMKNRDPD